MRWKLTPGFSKYLGKINPMSDLVSRSILCRSSLVVFQIECEYGKSSSEHFEDIVRSGCSSRLRLPPPANATFEPLFRPYFMSAHHRQLPHSLHSGGALNLRNKLHVRRCLADTRVYEYHGYVHCTNSLILKFMNTMVSSRVAKVHEYPGMSMDYTNARSQ